MNNSPGGQGAPFESRLLVGGFNPHNPQRFGGSVAGNCSTRTLPEGRRGARGSRVRNPESTLGPTGATKSATGVSGIPPSRFRAARVPHLNVPLWLAGSTPKTPSVSGGPWQNLNVAGRLRGGPGPPEAAPEVPSKNGWGPFCFFSMLVYNQHSDRHRERSNLSRHDNQH